MPKRNDDLLLQDIYEAGSKIFRYTANYTYDHFIKDEKTTDAVIRNFEIIGEASKRLSEQLKKDHPQIEWRRMMSFRDLLIHEYFGVNYEIVWDVLKNDLPIGLEMIKRLLKERQ